jgi:lysozyme
MDLGHSSLVRLVDLSAWQPAQEHWEQFVSAGVRGVICKASEGTNWRSPVFAAQVAGARAAGLRVGAYHFAHAGNVDAQLALFQVASGMLGQTAGELPPTLDAERAPNPPDTATAQGLLGAMEESWGCVPIVYGGADYLGTLGLDAHNPLWLAAYPTELRHTWPSDGKRVPTLSPWGQPRIWQFSESMVLGGVTVDASVFVGDAAAFADLCAGSRV